MAPKRARTRTPTLTKGALAKRIAREFEMKPKVAGQIISTLVEIAITEVKANGKFTLPGFCRIKTRVKPASKEGQREVFGKTIKVKAKPAHTIVRAFPLKKFKAAVFA